jgi:putative alpha-1,2-mannosidase
MLLRRRAWSRPWLRFADIARGARIDYALGARPNTAWGADLTGQPPSYAPPPEEQPGVPLPDLPLP